MTQQLVDEIVAAGGSLRVPRKDWRQKSGVDYERRAELAEAYGKVPRGQRLVVKVASHDELLLELMGDREVDEGEDGIHPGLRPVPVPERLRVFHLAARDFRSSLTLHEVSRKALPRVLRIVHALATEAERRGYQVACARVREDAYGHSDWKPGHDGQLVITVKGHPLRLRIWEKGAGLRGPYERQMKLWQQDRERPPRPMTFHERPKPYDSGATGELNIAALGSSRGRQGSWGDRVHWRLDDRLPHVLRELEIEAEEAEERRLAREWQEAERQRQWEEAMRVAEQRLVEEYRREVLRARVDAWREAEAIYAYCDAVVARFGADAVESDLGAAQWLSLAREQAARAQRLPRMPTDPEITPERLKPYLGEWNPYGPGRW